MTCKVDAKSWYGSNHCGAFKKVARGVEDVKEVFWWLVRCDYDETLGKQVCEVESKVGEVVGPYAVKPTDWYKGIKKKSGKLHLQTPTAF